MTTLAAPDTAGLFTLRKLQDALGLGRGVVGALVDAGYVQPSRGPRNEFLFTFQDVVLLRTAYHLQQAHVPRRKLLGSLRALRQRLPSHVPLSGLRIKAIGADVAVREGSAPWEAATGQLLLDFEVTLDDGGSVAILQRGPEGQAQQLLQQAEALEAADPGAAEALYRRLLALEPSSAAAYINLGALLCEARRCAEAVALFETALQSADDSATLRFNAAIALEDIGREADALAHYERCLELDAEFADAHYNAARICSRIGDRRGAIRHYNAYRRMLLEAAPAGTA